MGEAIIGDNGEPLWQESFFYFYRENMLIEQ